MSNGTTVAAHPKASVRNGVSPRKIISVILALVAMMAFQSIRFAPDLTPVGHALLSVLIFMLIIWITEAVGYAVS